LAVSLFDRRELDSAQHAALSVRFLTPETLGRQISLGDRACMATGVQAGVPVVTADCGWAALQAKGLKVEVIR
jgi:PIN domain nuclease of toxin-antitoxin system